MASDKTESPNRPLPLAGIRVVDLTMVMAGPLATELLAQLGAEVIKIEAVQRLDMWRGAYSQPGTDSAWEKSPGFTGLNRDKYGITLNLQDKRGVEIVKRLARIADIVAENYTPRVMKNFGLDYESLKQTNPSIIMISMPGYGMTGPWRDYVSFAYPTEMMSGIAQLTGYADGPPMLMGNTGGDPLAGLNGAVALLIALEYRRKTGKGQHIDLSQMEACTGLIGEAIMEYVMNQRLPQRYGNRHPWMAPHGTYRCQGEDAWVSLSVATDAEWESLCKVIGRPDLVVDSRFITSTARWQHQDELDRIIEQWTSQHEPYEAMHRLQDAGIAAGAVLNAAQLATDPHLVARGFYEDVERAFVGKQPYPRLPMILGDTQAGTRMPAPTLGQHNRDILIGLLGLSEEELQDLESDRVIGTRPLIG